MQNQWWYWWLPNHSNLTYGYLALLCWFGNIRQVRITSQWSVIRLEYFHFAHRSNLDFFLGQLFNKNLGRSSGPRTHTLVSPWHNPVEISYFFYQFCTLRVSQKEQRQKSFFQIKRRQRRHFLGVTKKEQRLEDSLKKRGQPRHSQDNLRHSYTQCNDFGASCRAVLVINNILDVNREVDLTFW